MGLHDAYGKCECIVHILSEYLTRMLNLNVQINCKEYSLAIKCKRSHRQAKCGFDAYTKSHCLRVFSVNKMCGLVVCAKCECTVHKFSWYYLQIKCKILHQVKQNVGLARMLNVNVQLTICLGNNRTVSE